ncbi:hypothetical protein [Streptomyces dengpaensis]|nr:hypothetical protein [Streptomyces dengpaensis]
MRLPKPERLPGTSGHPSRHKPEFRFARPEKWPEPVITTVVDTAQTDAARAVVHRLEPCLGVGHAAPPAHDHG